MNSMIYKWRMYLRNLKSLKKGLLLRNRTVMVRKKIRPLKKTKKIKKVKLKEKNLEKYDFYIKKNYFILFYFITDIFVINLSNDDSLSKQRKQSYT